MEYYRSFERVGNYMSNTVETVYYLVRYLLTALKVINVDWYKLFNTTNEAEPNDFGRRR